MVHRVSKSWLQLKQLSTSTFFRLDPTKNKSNHREALTKNKGNHKEAQGNVCFPFGTVLRHLQISHTISFWPADSPLFLKMNKNNFTFFNFLARRVHVSC